MKLLKARVENFRSAEDTDQFDINALTCLVGKNEAGKTAVLTALNGINPLNKYKYDKVNDYPRRYLTRYDERHTDGDARIATTTWKLSAADRAFVEATFGQGCLTSDDVVVTSKYNGGKTWTIPYDEAKVIKHLLNKHEVKGEELTKLGRLKDIGELREAIDERSERTPALTAVKKEIDSYRDKRLVLALIDALSPRMPKFFYTSHFDRMSGEISLAKLADDKNHGRPISAGDQIFLDFLEYAGTSLEELQASTRLEELNARSAKQRRTTLRTRFSNFGARTMRFG